MSFRESEKARLIDIKPVIWNIPKEDSGSYRNEMYRFCLPQNRAKENIFEGFREKALEYFQSRGINWHDGDKKTNLPSTHLCCSQTFCVNTWFSYMHEPQKLKNVLMDIGYNVKEMLPFYLDYPLLDFKKQQFVAFEWIGELNYLNETSHGKVVSHQKRTRGAGFTSADFAFRFLRSDDKIQIILGEWKYTENYTSSSKQISKSGKDRLNIYAPFLSNISSPINLPVNITFEDLFYDPFDQMMRLQLLAAEMERRKEMQAEIVSVLHISPQKNKELNDVITSAPLKVIGKSIHNVWGQFVPATRFKALHFEQLRPILLNLSNSPDKKWSSYMGIRYSF